MDTAFLRRYYVLFFIHVRTREVIFAGTTANPTSVSTTFDEILRTEGFKIFHTPARTPVANTFAERWIGSSRL